MKGRLVVAVLLFAVAPAAADELLSPALPPPPPPVVTFGSLALTTAGVPARAVGFSPDGRAARVFRHVDWQDWSIATGRADPPVGGKGVGTDDLIYPAPDGQTVLFVGRSDDRQGKATVVNTKTGRVVREKSFDRSDTLVPSDDGTAVAVAKPRAAVVWSLDDKTPELRVEGAADVRRFAKASAAGTFALLGDDRVTVSTPAGLWKLDPPKDHAYTAVALTADGGTLATASAVETDDGKRPGPVDLWDVKARQKVRSVEPVDWFSEAPYRLRFTPDGQTLVAGDGAYLRGWSTVTGSKTFAVEPGWGWVGNVQISPDGRHVAVAYAGRPMVYELATGRQPAALLGHSAPVWCVAFSPDGTKAATSMFGTPTVYLWDAHTGRNLGEVQAQFRRPADGRRLVPGLVRVQFSPDGTKLLTVNLETRGTTPMRVWDAATGGLLREIAAPDGEIGPAAFTRHGLFAVLDRKPTLLDPATGQVRWEKPPAARGARVAVSARGDRVAVEGRKETTAWNTADGGEVGRVPGEPLGFLPDGSGLIFEGAKRSAWLAPFAGGKERPVVAPAMYVAPRAGPAGLVAATAYPDTEPPEVRVYRATDGRLLSTCVVGVGPAAADAEPTIVFSDDGRTMAVAIGRGPVAVYETYSGQVLCDIPDAHDTRALVFDPAGRTLCYSRGGDDVHSQVLGHDATGGAWGRLPVVRPQELERLRREVGDKPAAARRAVYHLATRPPDAIAFADEVTKLPTAADHAAYARWLSELDAPAFATREAAAKGLAKGGWRAEPAMERLLAATDSVETRHRLEKLLRYRDVRPLRAVHLLEVVGTPAAVDALQRVAAGPADSLVVQDAKWTLLRLADRVK